MYKNETFLALILARGGSKRLPKKNVMKLCGKPLISWTIEAALNSKYIDKLVVSSDDDKIINISKKYKVQTIKRPDKFAKDNSKPFEAIKHALQFLDNYDFVILLQPTSPLRNHRHIDKSIEFLNKKKSDSVISVCENYEKTIRGNFLPKDMSMSKFFFKENFRKNHSLINKRFSVNGAIYICKTEKLLKEKSFFLKENIFAYEMNKRSSVDIDEKIDFKKAELILNYRLNKYPNVF